MKLHKQFLITASIALSLLLTSSFVAAQTYSNHTEIINSTIYIDVTGNPDVPLAIEAYDVENNLLIIESSGEVYADIYGGKSDGTGVVSGNKVIIEEGGEGNRMIYGGWTSGGGDVTLNIVDIRGTADEVYGGFTNGAGNVIGNTVVVSGSAINVVGGVAGGKGDVRGNRVEISGDVDYVYGGGAIGNGEVSDNSVEISGTVTTDVYGGWANGDGDIFGNSIEISGTVTNDVYGGWANGDGDIFGNSIEISGTINNEVYGGYTAGIGTVDNNIVTIENTANLANASLFGRNVNTNGGTGNTLNVNSFSGEVVEVNNFDIYNITIGQLDSSLTVIKINGGIPTDIDNATITISFARDFMNNNLNVGDVITVISYIDNLNPSSCSVNIMQSPFLAYNFIEARDNHEFLLTFTGMSPQPQTKALAEGFAAGLAFLGQAADVRSSIYFVPQAPRFIPFAKMVYGKQYISTGSSVNVKGFSALAGLAFNTNFDNGSQLVVGAFVEGGWGDYDSRNSFKNSATIKGSGDTEYYGGGLLARYATASGLYGEGTFAAGKTETDFRTKDFAPGSRSKYDYSVPYYSAHLAVGKLFNMYGIFDLDVYGKYLWTRQAGDNVTVDGYRFKFKDADSHRVRVGGKLQATGLPQLQPYAGAAFEYEFSGKIKGSLYGMDMDKPSLRGGTGIGELGLVWSPTESGSFKVDLGAQGYVGKREGVSGGLTVTMSF